MNFGGYFLVFDVILSSLFFGVSFIDFGLIKLWLDDLEFILFGFFVIFFFFDFLLLLWFLHQQFCILLFDFFFLILVGFNFIFDIVKFVLVGLDTDLENFFLFFELFIGDGVLMNFSNLTFSIWIILLHHHVQSLHLCF